MSVVANRASHLSRRIVVGFQEPRTVQQLEINRADRRSDLGVVVPEDGDLRNVDF